MVAAFVLILGLGGAWYAQPWGRIIDATGLQRLVDSGAVTGVRVTDGGVEGGVIVAPAAVVAFVPMLADFMTPFFMAVNEGDVAELARDLRARGVSVDVSWEIRRLTELAADAQSRTRYFGLAGGDVQSYALRLAELDPESDDAASLLRKVGERMAWDAEAALEDGPPDQADELLRQCLELVPDHPRCLEVSQER